MDACSASVLLGRGAWEKGRYCTYCAVPFSCGGRDNGQATQNKTSGLSAQRQHKAENAAKAGITGTRWNDNGNETDRSIHSFLLCSPIQFTAFPCLWQNDRQSLRETSNMLPERKFALNCLRTQCLFTLELSSSHKHSARYNCSMKSPLQGKHLDLDLSRDQKNPYPRKIR